MKVHDESLWQDQCAEFAADPSELALPFQGFVQAWAERAEAERAKKSSYSGAPLWTPIEALRRSLRATEQHTQHFTIGFIGQALLLLCTHWAEITDQEEFLNSMTTIEQNLFTDAATVWQFDRALKAQELNHE